MQGPSPPPLLDGSLGENSMHRLVARVAGAVALAWVIAGPLVAHAAVPRPEHPRPDAVRPHWLNLNGPWEFRFDPDNQGLDAHWSEPGAAGFDRQIVVPFP